MIVWEVREKWTFFAAIQNSLNSPLSPLGQTDTLSEWELSKFMLAFSFYIID